MTTFTLLQIAAGTGGALIGATVGIVVCGLVTFYVAVYLYPRYVYPILRLRTKFPADQGPSFERVAFPSDDGIRLAGWFGKGAGGRGNATIIVCHGWGSDTRDRLGLAETLRASGFNVLAFDFRGWGKSDPGPVTFGDREAGDVLGAVHFLKARGGAEAERIGVIACSMGAAAAIRAAARTPQIDAVVAEASYARFDVQVARFFRRFIGPLWPLAYAPARWRMERLIGRAMGSTSPLAAVPDISPRPLLIIHGTRDRVIDAQDARLLYQAAGRPKNLSLIEGAGHVDTRRVELAEYDARVVGFFRSALLEMG